MPTPTRTEIEQRADHEVEIDGVRPGRFVGFGDEGLSFDGEEPGPDDAKRAEEQAAQRTDEWDESLHPRGEHGRFGAGSKAEADKAASKLETEMGTHPFGFSWRPDTGHATTGIMVAEHPNSGSSTVLDSKTLAKASDVHKAVREYVEKHFDKIMADPSLHFGGWKSTDEKTGLSKFYLDISKRFPKEEKDAAIATGVRHNQKAVWDIDNAAEIDTGGTGEKT